MSADARASAPSLLASFGSGLLLATAASAVAALPAALRAGSDVAFVSGWLVLWGSTALVVAPAAGALRLARPISPLSLSVPLGLALALGPLVLLARVLKVSTHHRPLGGATFAIVAAGVVLGAIALSARLIAWPSARGGAAARALPWVVAILGAAIGAKLSLPALSEPVRASVLDGVLVLGALGIGAFAPLSEKTARSLRIAGVVAWLAIVALGLGLPAARTILGQRAPVLMSFAGWLR